MATLYSYLELNAFALVYTDYMNELFKKAEFKDWVILFLLVIVVVFISIFLGSIAFAPFGVILVGIVWKNMLISKYS